MPDILGTRLKVGSLVPSTNSSVEPEFAAMCVEGVTHMAARIHVPNQEFRSDADAEAIVEATQPDLLPALDRLMGCNPDRVVEDFEERFAKPVVSVNVACWWSTLRAAGITDRIEGFGRLLAEY